MENRRKINKVCCFISINQSFNSLFFRRMSFTKFHAQHFRASNPKCTVMTDIRSDNFEPEIEINFSNYLKPWSFCILSFSL